MDTSYLYSYNAERYQKLAERKLPCREKLNTTEVEQGYLLPNRFAKNRLFGCGGVLDAEKNYVKASEMNAYAKYAVPVTAQDEKEIYLGEGYTIDDNKVEYLDEEIIYLGYINNHWGHFLIDCSTRLYYYLEHMDENHKYAFLVNENEDYQAIAPIRRFFELLGIAECLIFIHKVTRCKKVIIPEQGYMINAYYSKQFLHVFEKVAECVDCSRYPSYEKVYYSRKQFKKAKGTEIGENILLDLFSKNGFTIISPEQLTLDEQIAVVRNTKLLCGIIGTLGHNMLFAKPEQHMILVNKTHNINVAQMDINKMKNLDMTYIDSYLAEFPSLIGNGPFLITYSEMLNQYVEKHNWKKPAEDVISETVLKRNLQEYEEMYRSRNLKNLRLVYEKNPDRFDYFAPDHLLELEMRFYHLEHPATMREKIFYQYNRVKRAFRRIVKR